jgi:CxxC motif-containing protein (DUF1111 family)
MYIHTSTKYVAAEEGSKHSSRPTNNVGHVTKKSFSVNSKNFPECGKSAFQPGNSIWWHQYISVSYIETFWRSRS